MSQTLKTPILFCIYNRPAETQRVFQAIRHCRPNRLLVVADGPNPLKENDSVFTAQARSILGLIDWPCELQTHFADTNLGCRLRMATGLQWAFDQSDELIVLEDDCLPHASFFTFCEQMLNRYRDDERVMMVSGDRFLPAENSDGRYYFSRWAHIWGWASWRRAWQHFDISIATWLSIRSSGKLRNWVDSDQEETHWSSVFDLVHEGKIDTWDFAWMYACWLNGGLTIIPPVNLISNIGFGAQATHTKDAKSPLANANTFELPLQLDSQEVARNIEADHWTYETLFSQTHSTLPLPNSNGKKRFRRWFKKALGASKYLRFLEPTIARKPS